MPYQLIDQYTQNMRREKCLGGIVKGWNKQK
jgi:hypothetical protein